MYLPYLVFVTPLLLPSVIVEELERSSAITAGSSNGVVTNTRCCRYSSSSKQALNLSGTMVKTG
jgi:hypothetical protein